MVSQRTITGAEALAIGQKLATTLGSISGKTSANYGTIDYSEIKNVINNNGKENYTFRIKNHPESSETVFFNLVMTQREGYTMVMLMKYEMDADFAKAYYTKSKGFTQFSGTVTTSLISSNDPCPPVVVPPIVIPYGGYPPDTTPDQGSDGDGLPSIPLFTILDANDNNNGNTGTGTTTQGTESNGCHCTPQSSNFRIAVNNGNDAEDPCPKDNTAGILSPEALQSFDDFRNDLPDDLENWLRSQPSQVNMLFFHYLYDNWFSDESKQFAKEIIAVAKANNTTIEVNTEITQDNAVNLATSTELNDYLQIINQEMQDDSVGDAGIQTQDKFFSTTTINISPLLKLTIEVVCNTQPNLSLDSSGCTSYISNIAVGSSWTQNSMSITNSNYNATSAQITLVGYNSVGIKMGELEFGIKQRKKIKFLINKTTGAICCSSVENLN